MLKGYRTYITIIIIALYNILRAIGVDFGDITAENVDIAVNTLLSVLAIIFNYIGRKRLQDK